ncbi:MAG: pentapeptide repeat-containing protein [Akkermansiaceae bacterium]|nr:pentapeptide repeat-containing protein [Akkermansiaceae bacterium]
MKVALILLLCLAQLAPGIERMIVITYLQAEQKAGRQLDVMLEFGTDLWGTDFSDLDLTGVDFSGCELGSCLFHRSILKKALFHDAHIYLAEFHGADLRGADFSMCTLDRCSNGVGTALEGSRPDMSGHLNHTHFMIPPV